MAMICLIYLRRPDINAVCHRTRDCHRPRRSRASSQQGAAERNCSLARLHPVAQYGTPGTPELSDALEPSCRIYDAILLANHWRRDLRRRSADRFFSHRRRRTFWRRFPLRGGVELLANKSCFSGLDVEKMLAARVRYGTDDRGSRQLQLPGQATT